MSFIPYQIDYSVQNTAKTIGFSKKRIIFKFGFANRVAIYEQQKTGAECRGSEHEILFQWSLTSGKRQLFCDQKEIHYSCSHQNGWTNDTSWQHILTLTDPALPHHRYRVHFITTKESHDASSHPFDLKINNVSYFAFNPIYQLGTPRMLVVPLSSSSSNSRYRRSDSPMTPEERQQLAMAKLASLQDIAQQRNPNPNDTSTKATDVSTQKNALPLQQQQQQQDDLLISFDDEDKKDMAAILPTATPLSQEHSISSIGFASSSSSGQLPSNTGPYHNPMMNASSITFDPNYSMNYSTGSVIATDGVTPDVQRQQPGSYYASTNVNQTNPYGSTQPSYSNSSSSSTNPYYTSTTAATGPSTSTSSTALTPYQPPAPAPGIPPNPYNPNVGYYSNDNNNTGSSYPAPAAQPQSYVDATGRLNIGVPPPAAPPPIQTASPWYNNNTTTTTNPYELQSPSATTVFTYGSAPSFAQPPKYPTSSVSTAPPPTTTTTSFAPYQNDFNYNSNGHTTINPYGNTVPMSSSTTTSPYGPPLATNNTATTTSMLYPPPPPQATPPPPQSFASTPSYHY